MTAYIITREVLLEKLYAFIRHETTLPELVNWAENVFVDDDVDVDVEGDTELLMDIIFCLAGSDTDLYPLTWDVLAGFVERLGGKMPVIVEAD